jgi:hypothetical protein
MKFKIINRYNNLFVYFMVVQCGFYIAPFFAAAPLLIDIDINGALIAHSLALLAFAAGYVLNFLLLEPGRNQQYKRQLQPGAEEPKWNFSPDFYTATYVLMLLGTVVVIIQVGLFRNPVEYLVQLLSGSYDVGIRDAFLRSSTEGGLSGILKMFGAVPLAAYLFSLSLPHFLDLSESDRKRMALLNVVSLVLTGVKVLYSLDRLTIMAVVIANVFMTVRTRKNLKIKGFLVIAFLMLIEFVSQRRIQGQGAAGFIVLYYNLGIVNLQLLLDTLQGYTYGFASILSPVTFVLKFFGMPASGPPSSFDFRYVGAQSLTGYVYQDFGPFFWIFFLLLGFLYKSIDRQALTKRNIYYVTIYFTVLSVTITFAAVPGFKNVDFWLGLIVPLVLVRLFAKRAFPGATKPLLPAREQSVSRPALTT